MPQDIKIWEIEKDNLHEIEKKKLDLEKRLEDWLEKDISILSNDYLVIGRQVHTDFGSTIDLLCIDSSGDVVIVELKRDKTPRDITAQALDYATWISELSNDRITRIADDYLRGKDSSLEKAFKEKFEEALPEIINENHKMLIVASEIDSNSERIVEYLSHSYGVGINIATFQHFKEGGKEYLARTFLVEPDEAEQRSRQRPASKRKPNLTIDELSEIAKKNGVEEIYNKLFQGLSNCVDYQGTTRSSLAFVVKIGENRRTIFSILPGDCNKQKGLSCEIRIKYFLKYFGIKQERLKTFFDEYDEYDYNSSSPEDKEYIYATGFIKSEEMIEEFISLLKKYKKK